MNGGELWHLASISDARGDMQQAIQLMRQAVDAGEPDALWGLSDLLERNGESAEAERAAITDYGGHGLAELVGRREDDGDMAGADQLVRRGIDAGNSSGLGFLASSWQVDDPYWQQARRFGLEADGRPSDPWRVGSLDHDASSAVGSG